MGEYKNLIVNVSYQKHNEGSNNTTSNLIRKRNYQKNTTKNIRLIGLALGVLTGLLVSFGTVFYVIERSEKYNNIKIIKADKVPFKLPPTDPGGLTVDNKDSPIYCEISDCDEKQEHQTILPLPEEPIFSKFRDKNSSEDITNKDPTLAKDNQLTNNKTDGKFQIQLGALRSENQAKEEWSRLSVKYPNILMNYSPEIIKVNLDQKGIFYRLRAGPVKDRETSEDICNSLLKFGVGCLVVSK